MKKVMITGMSGLIGGILRRHLEGIGGYEICALNRSPVEGVEWIQADIGDLGSLGERIRRKGHRGPSGGPPGR